MPLPFDAVRDAIWAQVAAALGGAPPTGFESIRAETEGWVVVVEVHHELAYRNERLYTRIRAPFRDPAPFRFLIHHRSWVTDVARLLGMDELQVGDPPFDHEFVVRTTEAARTRRILADPAVRAALDGVPDLRVHLRDVAEWYATPLPANGDELAVEVPRRLLSEVEVHRLFDAFASIMQALCRESPTYREPDPGP